MADSLAFAFRATLRRPGFSAVVVGTLALGIGANTLIFGVVDRLLLSPPQHIVDPQEVRHLWLERHESSGPFAWRRFSYPDYMSLHRVNSFRQLAAYGDRDQLPVGLGEDVQQAHVVRATSSLFPLTGARPLVGRFFGEGDDAVGAPRTAVLSEEYWDRRFGRDPAVVGQAMSIGSSRGTAHYEVIGIAPAGFTGAELDRVDLWIPLHPDLRRVDRWQDWQLNIVVRLAIGASPGTAERQATAVHRAVRAAWAAEAGVEGYDPEARVFTSSVIAARGPEPSSTASVSKWLAAVSFIVLALACANVANLFLANNIRIQHELRIKASLGAGPTRIAGQLLAQNLLLSILGGLLGIGLWFAFSRVLHGLLIPTLGYTHSALLPRVLAFALVATLASALGAGLGPALQGRRLTDLGVLRVGIRGSSPPTSSLRQALLGIQTALSVLLLIGAGLFVKSLHQAREYDLGFSAAGMGKNKLEFRDGVGRERRAAIYREALERLRDHPSLGSVASFTGSRPLEGGMHRELRIPGRDSLPPMPGGMPRIYRGSPEYPEVFGLRIIQGRTITASDGRLGAEPVMMVSEFTGRRLWPETGPLNRCAHVQGDRAQGGGLEPCRRIVGVFADIVHSRLDELPAFAVFLPDPDGEATASPPWGIVFRAEGALPTVLPEVRRTLLSVSPDIYFADVQPAATNLEQILKQWTLGARLFTAPASSAS